MPLATKIYWFYRDNCCAVGTISQIKSQLNNINFVNEILTDLFNTAARCQHDIAKLGDPNYLEGFEITVYDDLVDLHDRAVALYNELIQSSASIQYA